jgi:hypothetical protein
MTENVEISNNKPEKFQMTNLKLQTNHNNQNPKQVQVIHVSVVGIYNLVFGI